jgi:TolB-like protein/class 3 adenylate cyclase/Tfp pilus assembly protein PilF
LLSTTASGIAIIAPAGNCLSTQDTSAGPQPDLQLEVAHLLLIDVVGYSKLLVNEQIELLQELNQIVRSCECFRAAETHGKLIRLPTGDGMALLFYRSPEEPVKCALEISQCLKSHPHIQLRMGVHSGPVNQVIDVNDRSNVAGAGINVAQRVMDCGDAGHILLSRHVADDLAQYRHWQPYLHDIGECEVKHGLRLHVVNLYKDGLGNPALPEKLKRGRRWKQASSPIRPISAPRWPKVAFIAALLLSAIAIGLSIYVHRSSAPAARNLSEMIAAVIPEKSIAVMPFENLSDDKQNAYFADGVQDEILNDLAKVADLKVISRTSVMQYRNSVQRNLREIAKALGVAHILEGTVQRAGGRVRVSAQLIDARTDAHLWGERYDRDLADVFAIENELAEQIVSQLKSHLSPQEKAAIEERPTKDLVAYDLYARAKTLIEDALFSAPQNESLFEAVRLLNQALQRDPAFALAHYQLAYAHDLLYFLGADHTPARLAMADAAIQSLVRLRPNSGEAHLAVAKHLYWGYLNYDRAREKLDLAEKSLPNDPLPFLLAGYIDRRQSRWDESTKNIERAIELDPQNPVILQQIARSYQCLRRYADAGTALDRAVALVPKDTALRASRAEIELEWHADPRPLGSTIRAIIGEDSREAGIIAEFWLEVSLCERDFDGALRALAALPGVAGCQVETIPFPRSWCEGVVAQMRGDAVAARAAFTSAHNEMAKLVREQPSYPEALCALAMTDAALGHKEDAIREGRRAVELLPVTKESIAGSLLVQYLALIYAWTGEKDLAFEQLAIAARIPGYLSYGQLRLHPYFDSLRGDPRFDEIVASLAPK